MEWKKWLSGGMELDVPDLDEDDGWEKKPVPQPEILSEEQPEAVSIPEQETVSVNEPATVSEEERGPEAMYHSTSLPRRAPRPDDFKEEEFSEESPEEESRMSDVYDEEMDDDYDDYEEEPLPPMEAKKLKGRIRKIVRRFRIRSIGIDLLGAAGLAICGVSGILLHRLSVGLAIGVPLVILAVVFELFSWKGAAGDVNEELFTPDLKHRYRKIVFKTGVNCIRVLGILFAWEMAFWYLDAVLDGEFTWVRWGIYGVLFSILMILFLYYIHPMVQGAAGLAGIHTMSDEKKLRRRRFRGTFWLWRIVGLVLILGVAAGQFAFNQRDWKDFVEGKTFDDAASFREYVETEMTAETDESAAPVIRLSPEIGDPEHFVILDRYGNQLMVCERKNQKVSDVGAVYEENGVDAKQYIAYSAVDRSLGRWKVEIFNLLLFVAYPVITLLCGFISGRTIRSKERAWEDWAEDELDDEEYDD